MLVGNPSLPAELCYGVPSDCFGSALCEVKLRIAFRRAHREGDRRRAMSCTACGPDRYVLLNVMLSKVDGFFFGHNAILIPLPCPTQWI
jgi:hypothetical protein